MHFTNGLQALLIVQHNIHFFEPAYYRREGCGATLPFCLQISYPQENAILYTK
jgi:hypothetical protein